jgi:DNA-binding NtrC family response regulator
VWFFIHRHQRDLGRRIKKVPQAVMSALQQHAWPGNVRELDNVIERAMIRSTGDTLALDDGLGHAGRPVLDADGPTGDSLDAVQRAHIESILLECGWRINGVNNAADRLRIHPNTLRSRMKKLGIICPGRRHGQLAAREPTAVTG